MRLRVVVTAPSGKTKIFPGIMEDSVSLCAICNVTQTVGKGPNDFLLDDFLFVLDQNLAAIGSMYVITSSAGLAVFVLDMTIFWFSIRAVFGVKVLPGVFFWYQMLDWPFLFP